MNQQEYASHAQSMFDAPLQSTETPPGQIFPIGTRVRLLRKMEWPVKAGAIGTVQYSYGQKYHQFGFSNDLKNYSVIWDGIGAVAWFGENELELVS